MTTFDLEFFKDPLEYIQRQPDKTPEDWFSFCSVPVLNHQEKIPSLNINMNCGDGDGSDSSGKRRLVRFRGLVRDQLNPEIYLSKIKKCRSKALENDNEEYYYTNYNQDLSNISSNANFDDVDNSLSQRYPLIMTYVPGETKWFGDDCQNGEPKTCCNNENGEIENKDDKVKNVSLKKCVAKLYCHANKVAICDVVEVYGVYYPPLALEVLPEEDDYTSTLPSIHVLYWRKLEKWHDNSNNTILCLGSNNNEKTEFKKWLKSFKEEHDIVKLRSELIQYISDGTVQDVLVSEYILYNMISRIVHRNKKSSGILIGNLALLISHLPQKQENICNKIVNDLQSMYTQLLPRFICIDIDRERFNKQRIVPVKNHETQELMINDGECCLQVANYTQLMINQTNLTEGNLNECGVLNLQALKELVNEQKVTYDFQFHTLTFDCDIPVVILQTDKQKHLNLGFVTHACIPLKQERTFVNSTTIENDKENENNDSENHIEKLRRQKQKQKQNQESSHSESEPKSLWIDEKKLKTFRTYLSMARVLVDNFLLSENVTKGIEEDFVEMRKKYKNVTEDVLHYRLTLLRLINATLLNDDTVTLDSLHYMQDLENKRLARENIATN